MFSSFTSALTHALFLAPLVTRAASFAGCMPGSAAQLSQTTVKVPAVQGTDCIDQCTARGFEYSYSYTSVQDKLHYCQCGSEVGLAAHKDALHLSYEGERCYEDDATIYHIPSEFRFTHSIDMLTQNDEAVNDAVEVDTPGACYEQCAAFDRVYLLPPHEGAVDGKYQCLCDALTTSIEEHGVSMYNDASSWRRFDAPVASSSRLVFQVAGV